MYKCIFYQMLSYVIHHVRVHLCRPCDLWNHVYKRVAEAWLPALQAHRHNLYTTQWKNTSILMYGYFTVLFYRLVVWRKSFRACPVVLFTTREFKLNLYMTDTVKFTINMTSLLFCLECTRTLFYTERFVYLVYRPTQLAMFDFILCYLFSMIHNGRIVKHQFWCWYIFF